MATATRTRTAPAPTLADDLRKARLLKAKIAASTAALAEVTARLAEHVGNETGKHIVPDAGAFTVSENNVYSEDAIREALSPGQIRRVSKTVLDKAVVKRLYPDAYNGAKVNKGVKVTIN